MEGMMEYLSQNRDYVIALIITAAVVVLAGILGVVIKKHNLLRFMDGWFKKGKNKDGGAEADGDAAGGAAALDAATDESAGENAEEYGDFEETGSDGRSDTSAAFEGEGGDGLYGECAAETEAHGRTAETGRGFVGTSDDGADGTDAAFESTDGTANETAGGAQPEKKNSAFSEMVRSSIGMAEIYEKNKRMDDDDSDTAADTDDGRDGHDGVPSPAPVAEEPPAVQVEEEEFGEGKWRIMRSGSTYRAELHDEEGNVLLRSFNYSAAGEARRCVAQLKKHIKGNNFNIEVKSGKFRFNLYSSSDRLVCRGELCETNEECRRRIEEVKRIADKAEIVRG